MLPSWYFGQNRTTRRCDAIPICYPKRDSASCEVLFGSGAATCSVVRSPAHPAPQAPRKDVECSLEAVGV
eukprot:6185243-Pleurochrysis_carterae.AAC.11